jgi:chromosome segregation ATPase
MTHPTLPLRAALVAVFLLATAGASSRLLAADAPPKKAAAKPTQGKANVMTRDELRACMDEQDRLQEVLQQVQRDNTALDAQQADIKKLDAEIEKKRAGLDPADAAGQQVLVAEFARRDEQVAAFNAQLRSLNEQSRSLNERRAAWLAKCDGRNFDELDEAAIMRERKRAAGSAK